ncbi:DUF3806 domain-containing protein [Actinomyces bowdenii]|uniref:DUF3806 domain-containing protein n=1 Tax=Actinomyces bowdenii TaxID=131109 RepID=A0A853ES14_9ACTO|nr:DUF3806 domain-containing protein [Actinomyces bowdenii]MBF0698274.1 DUF3806 domain-containing protein [Actinomyces bowdenii]NYS70446.1 DUF3806 domain-containing protein [Actinomyces bowdenii]
MSETNTATGATGQGAADGPSGTPHGQEQAATGTTGTAPTGPRPEAEAQEATGAQDSASGDTDDAGPTGGTSGAPAQDPGAAGTGDAEAGTQILPLNEAEQQWVRDLLAYAKQLGITDSPRALEDFFEEQRTAWYAVDEESRADPNPLINLMGAVIGQILVERCEMKWCVLIDEQGTSLAVASEVGSIAMFPMNAVAKRWTGQNMTSLTEFLRLSQAEIRRVREEHAEEE